MLATWARRSPGSRGGQGCWQPGPAGVPGTIDPPLIQARGTLGLMLQVPARRAPADASSRPRLRATQATRVLISLVLMWVARVAGNLGQRESIGPSQRNSHGLMLHGLLATRACGSPWVHRSRPGALPGLMLTYQRAEVSGCLFHTQVASNPGHPCVDQHVSDVGGPSCWQLGPARVNRPTSAALPRIDAPGTSAPSSSANRSRGALSRPERD